MRKHQRVLAMLAAGMLVFTSTALAELINGTIVSVDLRANTLTLMRMAADTHEELQIAISENVNLRGVDSLADLKQGDKVVVDASPNPSGALEAKSIETQK